MKLSLVLIGKSGEIENLEILFFSKRLESQTQFELLLVGLRRFRSAKKAQTITGQRVNLD